MATPLWRVVGGADKGGILVRSGLDLKSAQFDDRLSHNAVVEQLSKAGDRLQYKLRSGTGPEEGWVSVKLKDKVLLEEELSDDAAKGDAETKHVYIDFPSSRNVTQSLDELEKLAEKRTRARGPEEFKLLEEVLDDLLDVGRDRDKRDGIVKFLGGLLSSLYVKANLKEGREQASNAICWKLCCVSFASSLQDILWRPAKNDNAFVVLMCGFGGSHMNDLLPAIDEWSNRHGAHVLAFGPALIGRRPMLNAVFEKLMSLLEGGQQLVVHQCSDGGFAFLRALLEKWSDRVKSGATSIKISQVLRCVVSDCAGLGQGTKNIIKDGTWMPEGREATDEEFNKGAQAFFTGCGVNMFIHAGACKAFYEEPANQFGMALGNAVNSNLFVERADQLPPDTLWPDISHLLAGVPFLVITSQKDNVVIMPRALFLAECVRQISGRRFTINEHWPAASEKILGDDGLAVHVKVFPKAAHCKAFQSDAAEYWEAVDRLVIPCISATR